MAREANRLHPSAAADPAWLTSRPDRTRHVPPAVTLRSVASPRLDVVIVSYRGKGLLRDCLESLREHPAPGGMTVHVVDNNSRDGTPDMVRSEFPEVTLTH